MEVRSDKRLRTKIRGITRFVVRTNKEFTAGLLPQREYVRGDDNAPFTTRRAAEDFEKTLRERIAGGASGASDKTFEDALEHWASRFRDKVGGNVAKQKHMNTTIAMAKNHLLTLKLRKVALGKVRLTEISEQLLYNELFANRGAFYQTMPAASSQATLLGVFKKIFALAVAQKWIPRSPAETLELSSSKKRKVVDLEEKQIDPAVYARLDRDMPVLLGALAVVAPDKLGAFNFYRRTGMRTGEIRSLGVSQLHAGNRVCKIKIDRAWKTADICLGPPKNGQTRYSAISTEFANELKAGALGNPFVELEIHIDEDQRIKVRDKFVFGDKDGRPASYDSLLQTWRQAQFAIRRYGMFKSRRRDETGCWYTLVKLDKDIDQFTTKEWKSLALGQKGLKKGVQREGLRFRTLEEAADHVGLQLFGLHDFRHLYASLLASKGLPLEECAARIGDDVDTFKRHYFHCFPRDESEDLRAIEAIG